jgi:hypothetical protein
MPIVLTAALTSHLLTHLSVQPAMKHECALQFDNRVLGKKPLALAAGRTPSCCELDRSRYGQNDGKTKNGIPFPDADAYLKSQKHEAAALRSDMRQALATFLRGGGGAGRPTSMTPDEAVRAAACDCILQGTYARCQSNSSLSELQRMAMGSLCSALASRCVLQAPGFFVPVAELRLMQHSSGKSVLHWEIATAATRWGATEQDVHDLQIAAEKACSFARAFLAAIRC